jgi:hypothetical protein
MSEQLDHIRREMLERHRLWALANPEEHAAESKKLAAGLSDIPVKQMLDQLQRIENEFLPAVRKKAKPVEVEFFEELARSLAFAIILSDRYEYLYGRFLNSRIDVALLKDRLVLSERELTRYTTMEDLMLSDSLDSYAKAIAARVKNDLLGVKK